MSKEPPYTVVPGTGVRGTIGRRMLESVTTKPHVTLFATASLGPLQAALEQMRPAVEEAAGVRLTLTGLLIKLVGLALQRYPRINGRVEGGEIRLYRMINVGVAVALDEGLIVPVLKQVDAKPLPQLAREMEELVQRARAGKLKPPDLMDGTFTVSNLGGHGVTQFTPVINPPEIAVLGVGRPVLELTTGGPAAALPLSLSFDHAAIDGAQAARFLQVLTDLIKAPGAVL